MEPGGPGEGTVTPLSPLNTEAPGFKGAGLPESARDRTEPSASDGRWAVKSNMEWAPPDCSRPTPWDAVESTTPPDPCHSLSDAGRRYSGGHLKMRVPWDTQMMLCPSTAMTFAGPCHFPAPNLFGDDFFNQYNTH